jgi:hypothetical protein
VGAFRQKLLAGRRLRSSCFVRGATNLTPSDDAPVIASMPWAPSSPSCRNPPPSLASAGLPISSAPAEPCVSRRGQAPSHGDHLAPCGARFASAQSNRCATLTLVRTLGQKQSPHGKPSHPSPCSAARSRELSAPRTFLRNFAHVAACCGAQVGCRHLAGWERLFEEVQTRRAGSR